MALYFNLLPYVRPFEGDRCHPEDLFTSLVPYQMTQYTDALFGPAIRNASP